MSDDSRKIEYRDYDPKDLYDPRDPSLYRTKYAELLHQTLAAQIHQIWCEWVVSMLEQGVIASDKVDDIQKLLVPFHELTPDDQRNHLSRTVPIVNEFVNWRMVDQMLQRGGPVKGKPVGGEDEYRHRRR